MFIFVRLYICKYISTYLYTHMRFALMRLTNQVDVNVQHRTSSTSSSSSSEDMNEEALHEKISDQRVVFDIDGPLFQNKKSRALHRTGRSSDVLRSGVKVFPAFLFLEQGSFFKWQRCGKCFKGEVLANASQAADMLGAMASKRSRLDD